MKGVTKRSNQDKGLFDFMSVLVAVQMEVLVKVHNGEAGHECDQTEEDTRV